MIIIWLSLIIDYHMMTMTPCQDHILTENIWFVGSKTFYSGDKRRCHQAGQTKVQRKIVLLSLWTVGRLSFTQKNFLSRIQFLNIETFLTRWKYSGVLRGCGFIKIAAGIDFLFSMQKKVWKAEKDAPRHKDIYFNTVYLNAIGLSFSLLIFSLLVIYT